jgi:choline O-acetyltransferase
LCMEQYYRLFTSYRVPGVDKDKLIDSRTSMMLEPEHIIVISRNQVINEYREFHNQRNCDSLIMLFKMYVLDVIVNFTRLSDDQLYHQLKRIKAMSEEEENTPNAFANIGFLTSLPRNEWAEARAELMKDSTNRDCLDLIERCIFIVCLDKPVEGKILEKDEVNRNEDEHINKEMTAGAYQMLHGCNSKNNSGNRWFDKTVQFIISGDGYCGLNYEHSPAEGIVVIELSEHLFRYL